jgi:hypothetical protein
LIASPVFGTPFVAAAAQLVIVMSGDYRSARSDNIFSFTNFVHRSKKEVAYMLVPAVGRKVIDLGGNIEKGQILALRFGSVLKRSP